MNSQTIIQSLISNQLIINAKMQAYSNNIDNLHMLITIATGSVTPMNLCIRVMEELKENPENYQ